MGRFYKATPAKFVEDKMFEVPFEQMAGAVSMMDKNIDEAYDKGQEIQDALDTKRLEVDDPEVTAMYQKYQDVANQAAMEMDKDPLSYRKQLGKLRRTSRELSSDIKTGAIGKAQEQFDKYAEISASVDKRTDLKSETKELYKKYLEHQYKQAGGLNYDKATGTYNRISDAEMSLVGEILDENKFISQIGTNFETDTKTTGGSWVGGMKGVDGDVVYTGTRSITERSAGEIKEVMEGELAARDYIGSRTQYHEMQQAMGVEILGDDGEPLSPSELARMDQNSLIERGITKLKKKDEKSTSTVKSLSSVTGKTNNTVTYAEIRDDAGTVADRETRDLNRTGITSLIDNGKLKGFSNVDDLRKKAVSKENKDTFKNTFTALKEAGMFTGPNGKKEFANWLTTENKSSREFLPADSGLTTAYNDSDRTFPITVYSRNPDGSRVKLDATSHSELLLNNLNSTDKVIYIPVTGQAEGETVFKKVNGYLVDKNNQKIPAKKGSEGEFAKTYEELTRSGQDKVIPDAKKISTYDTNKDIFKTNELKVGTHNKVNTRGETVPETVYSHSMKYLEYDMTDPENPTYKLNTIEIEVDHNRFKKVEK